MTHDELPGAYETPPPTGRVTADGHADGLAPVRSLDLSAVDSVDDLVRGMSHTSFGGRRLGEAADVLEAMVRDEACFRVLTLSAGSTRSSRPARS